MKSKNLFIALLAVIVYAPGFAQAAEPPEPKLMLISNVNSDPSMDIRLLIEPAPIIWTEFPRC